MVAYEIYDGRFIQEEASGSAANATSCDALTATPANRVRTVIAARYHPSVAETRTVTWCKITRSTRELPLTVPNTIALSTTIPLPLVTEGMEIKLWPGEYLRVLRDVATAGSTMALSFQFIETDIPFHEYVEPLKKVVQTMRKHGAVYKSIGGIRTGGVTGTPSAGHGGTGGGGGGAEPV